MDHWEKHLRNYDLFQTNRDSYMEVITFFVNQFEGYQTILDSGAGTGILTSALLKKGHKVISIDLNEYALDVLRDKCDNFSDLLEVRKMDVQELDFEDESFDGVSSIFVVPFVKSNEKYFSEIYRVLKKGCKFIFFAGSPVEDSWYGIMELLQKELEKKKILPKYQESWKILCSTSRDNINNVIAGPGETEIIDLLSEVGFRNINSHKTSYGKYAYLLTCMK